MRAVLLLVLVWLVLACTVPGIGVPATPTTEPTEGFAFIDARDPTATATLTTTATTAPTAVLLPNCFIRTDWFLYWVTFGETLSSIARRAGTTYSVLAAANCLANPNLIYAGQLLRVPVILPPPVTNTPAASPTQAPTTPPAPPPAPPTETATVLPVLYQHEVRRAPAGDCELRPHHASCQSAICSNASGSPCFNRRR